MFVGKKKFLICICSLCAVLALYNNSDDAFGSVRRILYTEEELEQMKDDHGCISRIHKLIYVHIPKTGGSTFENSELMDDARNDHAAGLRFPVRGHHSIVEMQSFAEARGIVDFATAATIRHPCSRFISAFRYLTSDMCNGFGLNTDQSVDEYVQYLEEKRWSTSYVHFRPQYTWILNANETAVDVDNFLCNEQWDEGIHRIKSVLGFEKIDTRRLYNYRGLGSSSDHFKQNQHEKCKDLKPETREAIQRYYVMDYCLFGYDELPPETDDVCIGTDTNAESMTKRFHICKEKLNMRGL